MLHHSNVLHPARRCLAILTFHRIIVFRHDWPTHLAGDGGNLHLFQKKNVCIGRDAGKVGK